MRKNDDDGWNHFYNKEMTSDRTVDNAAKRHKHSKLIVFFFFVLNNKKPASHISSLVKITSGQSNRRFFGYYCQFQADYHLWCHPEAPDCNNVINSI